MPNLLCYSPGACSLAPHIVLEEIGKPFDLSLVSTADGSTRSAAHLKLNPKGRVPVLVNGSFVLTEAPAILLHLVQTNPASNLMPTSIEAHTRAVEWLNWLSGGVHSIPVKQIWRPETFTDDTAQHAAIVAKGHVNLLAAFDLVEAKLATSTWALGDAYSVVDAFVIVFYRWGNRMDHDMSKLFPNWTRHTMAMLDRPAVQRALKSEEISVWE